MQAPPQMAGSPCCYKCWREAELGGGVGYAIKALVESSWDASARLVEENNGVFGSSHGCGQAGHMRDGDWARASESRSSRAGSGSPARSEPSRAERLVASRYIRGRSRTTRCCSATSLRSSAGTRARKLVRQLTWRPGR
jgi:hypothetical protein